ncbi:MAG: phosphatase PAP2 family protein [Caldilineaceae bacterium]|nr:phosphatase PAP2 family protein [Caldilineaceae bacterium]
MTTENPASEPKATPPPKQEVGDTPVPPWKMPTPEERAAVKPLRQTLREAITEVDSPEKADAIIDALTTTATAQTVQDVAQTQPTPTLEEATEKVKKAGDSASPGEKTQAVLAETAQTIAAANEHEREVLASATQEVMNPEQQGATATGEEVQRAYLRRALLKRLQPLDALDANLFLAINHLPHTRWLNRFFYTMTLIFTGGAAWYTLMAAIAWRRPHLGWRIIRESALPLALSIWFVEYPIKRYFRRHRPFITIVQAIVIGRKPGSWSFPSGHSATAFAGAWLLSNYLPRRRGLLYTIASLVAFSRVYLGDHYPGDVASGSTLGVLFAMLLRRLQRFWNAKI